MQLHSLRVKVSVFSLALVVAMCVFFILLDHRSLQLLLEKNRDSRLLTYQYQISGLLTQSREDLNQLTDLFVLWRGGLAPNSDILHKLFDQQWEYLRDSWGLESLKLYSPGQQPPRQWGAPTRHLTPEQVGELIASGETRERFYCVQTCVQSLVMGITAGDLSERYVLQVDRSLADELLSFHQITGSDIGILSPIDREQAAPGTHLPQWRRSVLALTSRERLMPLLREVATQGQRMPGAGFSGSYDFSYGSFDVKTIPLVEEDPDGAQFVIIDDVSGQVRHIEDSIKLLLWFSAIGAVTFIVALIGLLWRPIFRLRRLAEALPLLSDGNFDEARRLINPVNKPRSHFDEIDVLDYTGLAVCDQLEVMKEIVAQNTAELEHIALHDTLTGLDNRHALVDRIEQYLHGEEHLKNTGYVFFIDLDDFKRVNDSLGHQRGDELLQVIARRLVSVVRRGDTVARLGGDEFCVFVPSADGEGACRVLAEKLLGVVAQPVKIGDKELRVTLSIGIVAIPRHGDTLETILQRADVAMYHAKYRGKNNYQLYSEQLECIEHLSTGRRKNAIPIAIVGNNDKN
ncbi:GGDEF domain-containing protein [Microbulbifer yueqingensis]|uniref:Diguanylate cyclase (GGDEF) domain-containing protein n=1 Tax=Microbulbifer yueqingensis TaxID=658219 RepID=A0A1G8X251_9GAMM|nr:GGDEF domain-containing protein [Microbulbifer yueqingensis]SDJ84729.1 diguanylate cyclase (GGDEF) domain-containing protein [Microbulbifer yueqingensis]